MQHPTRTTYYLAFATLLCLLALTVGVAFLALRSWSPVVAMTIAVAKAVLIVLYFMHVRYETPLVRVFAIAGFLWLGVLLAFLLSDYLTRTEVRRAESPPYREALLRGPAKPMTPSAIRAPASPEG